MTSRQELEFMACTSQVHHDVYGAGKAISSSLEGCTNTWKYSIQVDVKPTLTIELRENNASGTKYNGSWTKNNVWRKLTVNGTYAGAVEQYRNNSWVIDGDQSTFTYTANYSNKETFRVCNNFTNSLGNIECDIKEITINIDKGTPPTPEIYLVNQDTMPSSTTGVIIKKSNDVNQIIYKNQTRTDVIRHQGTAFVQNPNTSLYTSQIKVDNGTWRNENVSVPTGRHTIYGRVCSNMNKDNCSAVNSRVVFATEWGYSNYTGFLHIENRPANNMQSFAVANGRVFISQSCCKEDKKNIPKYSGFLTAFTANGTNRSKNYNNLLNSAGHMSQIDVEVISNNYFLWGECGANGEEYGTKVCRAKFNDDHIKIANPNQGKGIYGSGTTITDNSKTITTWGKYSSGTYNLDSVNYTNVAIDNTPNSDAIAFSAEKSPTNWKNSSAAPDGTPQKVRRYFVCPKSTITKNWNNISTINLDNTSGCTSFIVNDLDRKEWQGFSIHNNYIFVWEGGDRGFLSIYDKYGNCYLYRYEVPNPDNKSTWEPEGVKVESNGLDLYIGYVKKTLDSEGNKTRTDQLIRKVTHSGVFYGVS